MFSNFNSSNNYPVLDNYCFASEDSDIISIINIKKYLYTLNNKHF
jgi:hypothetical protein